MSEIEPQPRLCFACGTENKQGLHMTFRRDGERTICDYTPCEYQQGYPGRMHGGIVCEKKACNLFPRAKINDKLTALPTTLPNFYPIVPWAFCHTNATNSKFKSVIVHAHGCPPSSISIQAGGSSQHTRDGYPGQVFVSKQSCQSCKALAILRSAASRNDGDNPTNDIA